MPYLKTGQEWSQESALLLQARPTTTRITTKYTILQPKGLERRKAKAPADTKTGPDESEAPPATQGSAGPRGALTLKTYDPESGVCLKYQTDEAREVGRLIASLGRLGRNMAALPDVVDDTSMPDAPPAEQATGTSTPVPEVTGKDTKGGLGDGKVQGGGGPAAKKKKKGKR